MNAYVCDVKKQEFIARKFILAGGIIKNICLWFYLRKSLENSIGVNEKFER